MKDMVVGEWPLVVTEHQKIKMPVGSQILAVQERQGLPCLIVLVSDNDEMVEQEIVLYRTGQPIGHAHGRYIGTVQIYDGFAVQRRLNANVLHVFEIAEGLS